MLQCHSFATNTGIASLRNSRRRKRATRLPQMSYSKLMTVLKSTLSKVLLRTTTPHGADTRRHGKRGGRGSRRPLRGSESIHNIMCSSKVKVTSICHGTLFAIQTEAMIQIQDEQRAQAEKRTRPSHAQWPIGWPARCTPRRGYVGPTPGLLLVGPALHADALAQPAGMHNTHPINLAALTRAA